MFKTIYHVTNGPTVMYEIDARHALANFPEEWKETDAGEATAARDTASASLASAGSKRN